MRTNPMESERAAHWQEEWQRAGLATARRDPDRAKYYAIVAYPGPSGFLHVGHLRGIVYADAFHRFHRMLGEQVFFPAGVHASGLPAVTYAQKVKDRNPTTVHELEQNGIPPADWPKLEDPEFAARFLGAQYLDVYRRVGVLVDESAHLTTVDDDYRAFIRWQFDRLRDRDALVQKTHYSAVCPVCGPVAVDPSETDLSAGGTAEIIRYTTVPFRLQDGRILLAATLRPETIYGVTNLWIPLHDPLVSWTNEGPTYLVSRAGAERLVEQHGGRIGHEIRPAELKGRSVIAPLTGVPVPVFPSSLVDPRVGTGVVMSVPAHAPADSLALSELTVKERESLRPAPVILAVPPIHELPPSERELAAGTGTPAERANRATGAKKLADAPALKEATERLYRLEFTRGTMTVRDYLGVPVRDARERVTAALGATKQSFELQEFSEPVICRNGHAVVIRRVPHQWFIRYSDPEWKALGHAALRSMAISPEDYAHDLPAILDWMDDRPCTRRGRWMGTPLPFDPEWIVEPIADSTLYPAYYVVRRFVRERGILPSALTDAFFDFVFLGEGSGEPTLDAGLQQEIRADFLYWYPLDCNVGGKEHKRVHFPPFLLTHAKLLPPELGPRGIFVHGWVTGTSGEKISKKDVSAKGGRILAIREALARWGPDALRLVYASSALPSYDFEWDPALADAAVGRLEDIQRMAREAAGAGAGIPELDAWLFSEMHGVVARASHHLRENRPREAAEAIYVAVPALLKRYYARGGVPGDATDRVANAWSRMLSPFTPHLAEELGAGRFPGLVASERFPSAEEFPRSEVAEAAEAFLAMVEDDLRNVMRPLLDRSESIPDEVIFYVAAPWKRLPELWIREALESGATANIGKVMERANAHPELVAHRAEIPKYVQRIAPLARSEGPPSPIPIDEVDVLRSAQGYLVKRFGFKAISVHREEDAEAVDPMHRRDRARPGRPAFYLARRDGAPAPPSVG